MAVHHGGKVGKAGKTLASKSSSKQSKSKAGTTLANHKAKCHQYDTDLKVDKSRCIDAVKNIGVHAPMQKYKDGKYYWDYQSVKDAMDSQQI